MSTALTHLKVEPPAKRENPPTVLEMIERVVERGITAENVAALTELNKLHEAIENRQAEKAFAAAFVALQGEMPKVQATKIVPSDDGSVRYKFAPFEDLMNQVSPLLQKHGFSVSFDNSCVDGKIIQTCTLQHVGGHKRQNSFGVMYSKPPKTSDTQGSGSSATYAKRFALCDALNIVVAHVDDDARLQGTAITPEQANELRERVKATASDEKAFLKFAGAKTFEEIQTAKYAMLDANLKRKERT